MSQWNSLWITCVAQRCIRLRSWHQEFILPNWRFQRIMRHFQSETLFLGFVSGNWSLEHHLNPAQLIFCPLRFSFFHVLGLNVLIVGSGVLMAKFYPNIGSIIRYVVASEPPSAEGTDRSVNTRSNQRLISWVPTNWTQLGWLAK